MEVNGVPEYVIVNGRVCVDDCDLKAVHGYGRFVETPIYPPYVYDLIEEREQVRKIYYKSLLLFIIGQLLFYYSIPETKGSTKECS